MIEFDFSAFKAAPPPSVIIFLAQKRMDEVITKIKSESYAEDIFAPVNPLLLASAISISLLKNQDFQLFLNQYISGSGLSNLETSLLKAPSFETEEELNNFLDIEDNYTEAFCLIALERILYEMGEAQITSKLQRRENPNDLLIQYWKQVTSDNIPEEWDLVMSDVYWRAWMVANPVYSLTNEQYTMATLFRYGFAQNDTVNNNREYYEYESNEKTKEFNVILKADLSKEEKKAALMKAKLAQSNATRLQKRAFRLYEWLPTEVDANRASKRVVKELFKGIKSSSDEAGEKFDGE